MPRAKGSARAAAAALASGMAGSLRLNHLFATLVLLGFAGVGDTRYRIEHGQAIRGASWRSGPE